MSPIPVEKLDSPPNLGEIVSGALIDGSITYQFDLPSRAERAITLPTPAGESPVFYLLRTDGVPFWYIHFHGVDFMNAKANVEVGFTRTWHVLHALGIRDVISGAATGSVHPEMRPCDVVIMDDFIDLSTHRPRSMHTELWWKAPYVGAMFTPPLCPELTRILVDATGCYKQGRVFPSGTLAQFEGHRFESPAEIRMVRAMGGDMVAHHQASEAIYARELGIHFGALNYVTNIAAGLCKPPAKEFVTDEEAHEGYSQCTQVMFNAMAMAARRDVGCKVCPQPEGRVAKEEVLYKDLYR
jgi:5'-methylthioadenosine phosphorylase